MVTIKFYKDPSQHEARVTNHKDIITYLSDNYIFKDQLLDLRFFHDEILGKEIDVSDVSFLDISEGVIAITPNSMIPRTPDIWIYIAISVVFAAITVALTPSLKNIGDDGDGSKSATNRLGASSNEPRVNERIDDIFGTVTKHTPPLWQVPYRIGVDNQETEVLLLAIGRGKYFMEEETIFDGDTRVIDIQGAKFSKYEPGTYPGNGSPSLQIGDDIDEEIGIYRQSNDLNPAEILPWNELEISGLIWQLSGNLYVGTLVATIIPDEFNFQGYYNVGDEISLKNLYWLEYYGDETLYNSAGVPTDYPAYLPPVDLGEDEMLVYEITAVTSNTLTVIIPANVSTEVYDAWQAMTNHDVWQLYIYVFYNPDSFDFYTWRSDLETGDYYTDVGLTKQVGVNRLDNRQFVGKKFSTQLGPFTIPNDATEIILNFVSENGFYKLINNYETAIAVNLMITIYEVDVNGDVTGESITYPTSYASNYGDVRGQVFKTRRKTLPYTYNKVSVARIGDRDKANDVSNVDVIKWRNLYSFEPVSNLNFGDVTLAHVVIPSNSDSQLIKERRQNMNVTRLITEYLGNDNFGPAETFATDDFSQILIHTSLDPRIGRLTLADINADGFIALAQQIITYFGSSEMIRFGYDFDNSGMTYQDTFIKICDVVNCLPYVQAGVYDAFFEREQTTSSMQITVRNKIPDSESREQNFERRNDGVELSYRDENSSVSEVIYLPSDRSAVNPERRELSGCVTELQAFRYASRVFNKQLYSRMKVTFDVDEFGRNIIPGKRIDSPDGTRFTKREGVTDGYRVYEGEVIETIGLNVELSEPIEFTPSEDHYIVFTKDNGDNSAAILCTEVDEFNVTLNNLPAEAIYDGYSKDRTKYVFCSEQLRESVALIPQTIEFKMSDDGSETNTIDCINYSSEYYKDDLEVP